MASDIGMIMTRDVVTAAPHDSVAAVARLLAAHAISAVPVCEPDGTLVGIISEGDLLRPFGQQHNLRRDWWLSLLAEGDQLAPDFVTYISADQRAAKDLMTTPVRTITEQTPIAEAADLLIQNRIKRLPVVRAGKLVGIVSRADLLRAFLDFPRRAAA